MGEPALDLNRVAMDAAADSIAVMLPIPADIAAKFPDLGDNGEPHVTMVYVGAGDAEALATVQDIVLDESRAVIGETLALGGPDYFDSDKGRAVFARVTVPEVVRAARDRIAKRISDAGIDVGHIPLDQRMDAVTDHGPWVPHATLAYLPPGEDFTGATPTGEWTIDALEVWHGDDRHAITGDRSDMNPDPRETGEHRPITYEMDQRERAEVRAANAAIVDVADKLREVGGKWQVLTDDGNKVLGEFDTEDEARERLRQVEAAKAAKQDGDGDRKDQAQTELFAPAVHTETRLAFWAPRVDAAQLLPPIIQPNGWRRYPVLYSKAGNVQEYVLGGKIWREWRDPRGVFDRASMDGGQGVPWELRHSKELLTPDTVRGVARGCVLTVDPHSDGIHTAGTAVAWDAGLFEAIHGDAPEISVANRIKIDPRPGTSDDGKPFDRRQIQFIWNSIASEPRGAAGTARVLTAADRLDAGAIVISRADEMLAIANGRGPDPGKSPIHFDRSTWVRHDSAATPSEIQSKDLRKDQHMDKIIKALLEAGGMTPAALAEKLGVEEADVAAMLAGESDLSDDLIAALVARDDAEPEPEPKPDDVPRDDADGVALMVGDASYMVDPKVAAAFEILAAKADIAGDRADEAEIALKTATEEAKTRQDAMGDMVTRSDAAKMASDQALHAGSIIEMARRANGPKWQPGCKRDASGQWVPEVRQDSDGKDIPTPIPTVQDWARGALVGIYGADDAAKKIARMDSATGDAAGQILDLYIDEAVDVLAARSDKTEQVKQAIAANRDVNEVRRQDGAQDKLATAKQQQRDLALGVVVNTTNQPGA